MTDIAEDALEPDPADAVEMVLAVCQRGWPATDAAVRELIAALGLRPVEANSESGSAAETDPRHSAVATARLDVPFGGAVFATWSSHAGAFLGITLQLYNSLQPNDPLTRRGYDSILGRLTYTLGAPADAWDDEAIPPRIWTVGGWRIVLHFFHRRDSGVMLSVSDAVTEDRAEREASAAQAAETTGDRPYLVPRIAAAASRPAANGSAKVPMPTVTRPPS
jgi:hypothetical protein